MITSELVKWHLKIDEADELEDTYIGLLVDAATSYVSKLTKIKHDPDIPDTYKIACLLLIGHWYSNREAVSDAMLSRVPYGFSMLLDSMRPATGLF